MPIVLLGPQRQSHRTGHLMATERCTQCGRGLRDGECTHPDCGYVPGPTLRLVKPAVDRPHPPTTTSAAPPAPDRTPPGPPTDTERRVGIPWVERCRRTLAEHTPPAPPVATRLRRVAETSGSAKARAVALEVAAQVETGTRP